MSNGREEQKAQEGRTMVGGADLLIHFQPIAIALLVATPVRLLIISLPRLDQSLNMDFPDVSRTHARTLANTDLRNGARFPNEVLPKTGARGGEPNLSAAFTSVPC